MGLGGIQAALAILLVQACILPAAGESACIVPGQAGWMEGGLRGERQRKREQCVCLSVSAEGARAEGAGRGCGRGGEGRGAVEVAAVS